MHSTVEFIFISEHCWLTMEQGRSCFQEHRAEAGITLWKEALCGVDFLLLHAAPAYYGLGIPRGDDSAVILVPGFLTNDLFLKQLHLWLKRIGYRPYQSGMGVNAECPNLLIKHCLDDTIAKARRETGRKVHLIGHSLGGVIARSIAVQRPGDVASVITLGAPFRGIVAHPAMFHVAGKVRRRILEQHGPQVSPNCYTPDCTCEFSRSLRREFPSSVSETAIYTRDDGVVDWQYCRTEDSSVDFEVSGTHVGLPFNSSVYAVIAARLAQASARNRAVEPQRTRRTQRRW